MSKSEALKAVTVIMEMCCPVVYYNYGDMCFYEFLVDEHIFHIVFINDTITHADCIGKNGNWNYNF